MIQQSARVKAQHIPTKHTTLPYQKQARVKPVIKGITSKTHTCSSKQKGDSQIPTSG